MGRVGVREVEVAPGWRERVTRQLPRGVPADPAAQCAPVPGLGKGAAVRKCVCGPELPPQQQQPLFLNFKWSEGAAGEGSPPSGLASSSASGRPLDLPPPSRLCVALSIPGGAQAPGSACGPLSMAAASLGDLGVSAATAAAANGQARGSAAHHARPGPTGNNSEAGALRGR